MSKPPPPTRYGRGGSIPAQPRQIARSPLPPAPAFPAQAAIQAKPAGAIQAKPAGAIQAKPAGAMTGQRVYAPPPTRFTPPSAVQQKAQQPAQARTHAPPTTRYAAGPALQAKAAPSRPQGCPHCGPGGRTIQMMQGIEYFNKQVDDQVGNAINFAGQSLGPAVIRQPRSFKAEKDAKFLRNLSTFLWYVGEMILTKADAEVESMYVNNRILVSANNPGTMQEIYKFILENEEFNEFIRTDVMAEGDARGQRTINNVSDQLMSPDMSVNSAFILQSIMLEKTKEYVKLATIRNKGLTSDVLTSGAYSGKLILIKGLPIHAEQKLLLALVTSGLPKNTQAVIRGKKRPCFGCWLCLSFAKEVLGYSGLDFNNNPGKAWKNSIDSLSNLVKIAVNSNVGKKAIDKWADEKMGLHKKDQLYTYISSGYLGKGQDQGYDTESDDEDH